MCAQMPCACWWPVDRLFWELVRASFTVGEAQDFQELAECMVEGGPRNAGPRRAWGPPGSGCGPC